MATKNLSKGINEEMPSAGHFSFGIVVSEWNQDITENLLKGALQALKKGGVAKKNIHVVWVPGSFELAHGAQLLIESQSLDAVICLGSIIKGETPHFDFVSQATAQGIMNVGLHMLFLLFLEYSPMLIMTKPKPGVVVNWVIKAWKLE